MAKNNDIPFVTWSREKGKIEMHIPNFERELEKDKSANFFYKLFGNKQREQILIMHQKHIEAIESRLSLSANVGCIMTLLLSKGLITEDEQSEVIEQFMVPIINQNIKNNVDETDFYKSLYGDGFDFLI